MKKYCTLLSIPVIMLVTSCNKKDNNSNTNIAPTYYLKAKINDTLYEGVRPVAGKTPDTPVVLSTSCFITYKDGTYGLAFGLYDYYGVGTYIGRRNRDEIVIPNFNGLDGYRTLNNDSTLIIKILSDDNATIKGEFSGKLYNDYDPRRDSVIITEGTFYLPLTK